MTRRAAPGSRPVTVDLVRAALASIPADLDRERWLRVAMALKASDLAEEQAFELFDAWSQGGDAYSATDVRDVWRSVKAGGRVTVATLFGLAKSFGFRFPADGGAGVQTPAPDSAEAARLAEEAEKRRRRHELEEAERRQRADRAALEARRMWAEASEQGEAGYLVRKGVRGHGVRYLADGTLLVPMRNAAGELQNLQRIAAERPADGSTDKRFLPGGRKAGLWHLVGQLDGAAVLLLAEGYATAATLHEATGLPVAVAFDAGNLPKVAAALRELHPALPLLVCADNDHETEARSGVNPGLEKARTAARSASTDAGAARVLVPAFGAGPDWAGCSDFNDLAARSGPTAVAEAVRQAVGELLAGAPDPEQARRPRARARAGQEGGVPDAEDAEHQAGPEAPSSGAGGAGDGQAHVDGEEKGRATDAPWLSDPFELDERGVWHRGRDREGNEKRPQWLCAPLRVTARTRADDANGWGYLLEFADPDGNAKTWAMPAALLSGEGSEWAARLRDMGLMMAPGVPVRNLLAQYIDTRNPTDRVTCTDRVGWHGPVYVLPSGCIGTAEGRRFVFQSEAGMEDAFRRSGSLQDWRDQVAGLAAGNSRLVFALSVAFAGPLLRPAGMESGGVHFRGASSLGKSTALKVAASVWGRPDFMLGWRTTDNALESTAVCRSDCTLILDEFGQVDPRVAGECAYLLANEREKGRNTRSGVNRKRRTWRLLFLSSGEVSLGDHMAEAGKRPQAGMEVRMVDVPLDAGAGMGGLELLHGRESPAELADELTRAAARRYGAAGRAWLEWLAGHFGELPELLHEAIERYRADMLPEAASEQVRRVASRFALVAAAGELATREGITGWTTGEAARAARRCFEAWLAARGHLNNGEEAAMLRQVQAWLERNADAQLTWMHRAMDDHRPTTMNRAGFKRLVDDQGHPLKFDSATDYLEKRSAPESSERAHALVEYLLLPETFRREVCRGLDFQAVGKLLQQRQHLKHDKARLTMKQRLPGVGNVPCYRIQPSIFEDAL